MEHTITPAIWGAIIIAVAIFMLVAGFAVRRYRIWADENDDYSFTPCDWCERPDDGRCINPHCPLNPGQ